ncbi:MAG: RNA polymerase sigma factor [Anaerolineae bacterium]|nr:RNA polymerase sigma factor [Anaerolineae bacterium]MCO5192169.1 RNA polymerase sigma factor [Anaerolineae bacterium]
MSADEQKRIFDGWIDQHKGIIFKIVRAYAFTPDDQDDLFQEIALQVWQSIPDFRGDAQASTWIYRVALFTATNRVRREKRRPPTQWLGTVEHMLTARDVRQDDQVAWLYEQIALLSPIDRSVCLLLLDGFSYKEIAALLGISESNVGVKIHRVKQHLLHRSREVSNHGV